MRRLLGVLALWTALSFAPTVPDVAAQSYGPGLGPDTWYGPYASPIGTSGFGSTGYGCGLGAYGFANYGHGTVFGLGPGMPQCGGFGNYPYLYPYYTGYPFANGVGLPGALALSGLGNSYPFIGRGCDAVALGGNFAGQPQSVIFPGAAGQFAVGSNTNLVNVSYPSVPTFLNFATFGSQNLQACVGLR